jgi:hypothetical protein
VTNVFVHPGAARVRQACAAGERLISASYAIGFFMAAPPSAAQIGGVQARLTVRGQGANVVVRAGPVASTAQTTLQVGVECAGGR